MTDALNRLDAAQTAAVLARLDWQAREAAYRRNPTAALRAAALAASARLDAAEAACDDALAAIAGFGGPR